LEIEKEWLARMEVPAYVFAVIDAMPLDSHPMTMFSTAILALQREALFAHQYHEGLKKDAYWEPTLEDSLNLTAKLPAIAAYIYRRKYRDGKYIAPDPKLDWGANFAHMMGVTAPGYADLARLYFIIHSDHESGNVSAHATHLVGSALSDMYYAGSAAMNGLAGPLHGLANQECLGWLLAVYSKFGGVPNREQLRQFAWDTLNSGQVIPGYGHAVLRKTDPRFTAQLEFGNKHFPDDDVFSLAALVYEVIPQVLMEQGKAKDPWPNVDAISGALQYHYGVREFDFYTVMFGVSRLLGVSANLVWARALGQPIERPKSLTTAMLEEIAAKAKNA
jgi:citrate synthase